MIKAIIFDCTGVLVGNEGAVNARLLDFIQKELKPKYQIGMLTNLSLSYIGRLFTPAQINLFDSVSTPSGTGVAKPDPKAYQNMAAQLGALTNECIFIDDFQERCASAQATGMQAIVFTGVDEAITAINDLLKEG